MPAALCYAVGHQFLDPVTLEPYIEPYSRTRLAFIEIVTFGRSKQAIYEGIFQAAVLGATGNCCDRLARVYIPANTCAPDVLILHLFAADADVNCPQGLPDFGGLLEARLHNVVHCAPIDVQSAIGVFFPFTGYHITEDADCAALSPC